ncbi:hypothetical protein LMG31506_06436 [Cupriavidus yeoncheonensis]|uniref:Uncharacterized protein n=1 Tax=Cupriavidus yeoncheonensis TaxID=1462994 RepID=A0A916N109_9BURK|nr:hypothetical protein [Cupriavidus yeoncheonensis]CAG2158616.1 hypothetical protein LMG31506_06436 [Cupriavidus yeoncheonensis]
MQPGRAAFQRITDECRSGLAHWVACRIDIERGTPPPAGTDAYRRYRADCKARERAERAAALVERQRREGTLPRPWRGFWRAWGYVGTDAVAFD